MVDNWMHQAPYPTVHLIRRHDLNRIQATGHDSVAELLLSNTTKLNDMGWDELRLISHHVQKVDLSRQSHKSDGAQH
eukprot:5277911-Amphidinium_carterae.1